MPVILDIVCPVTQGGIPGREEATGRGVQYVLREFFRHPDDVARSGLEGSLEGKRVNIQGLGNVGFHAAKCFTEEEGVRLVGVFGHDGALLSDAGLAPVALAEHRARVVRRAIVTPHNRMRSVGYRADRRQNLALNNSSGRSAVGSGGGWIGVGCVNKILSQM